MRNDYAWTPVFDKNESKDRKKKQSKAWQNTEISLFEPTLFICTS